MTDKYIILCQLKMKIKRKNEEENERKEEAGKKLNEEA